MEVLGICQVHMGPDMVVWGLLMAPRSAVCRFSMMGFGGLGGVCLRSFLLGSLELCTVRLMAGPGVIGVLESK